MPLDNIRFASSRRSLASLRDNGRIFPETEQLALSVKTVGYSPELASTGGNEKKQTSAVEIFAGPQVGFQTADMGIGKRHGYSLAVVGRRDTHMDKNILIPRGYSCRYQKCHTTFLPTDIPIKCLDASGRSWTSGNHTGKKNKERQDVMHLGVLHCTQIWRPQADLNRR